jgi:hypothetical protein
LINIGRFLNPLYIKIMAELTFKMQRGFQIDPKLTTPVDEQLLLANKSKVSHKLSPYIDRLNSCGAYILVTVEQDGKSFNNRIMGCEEELFGEIIDKINGL